MTDILAVAGRVWDYLGPISRAAAAQHAANAPYAELRKEAQYFEFGLALLKFH